MPLSIMNDYSEEWRMHNYNVSSQIVSNQKNLLKK